MALVKKTQRSFSGGMIDKDLTGRQDMAKYAQGCLELVNFKVRKQGNVVKRAGTDLTCDFSRILGPSAEVRAARLVPLVRGRLDGLYVLLTGSRAFLLSRDGAKMDDGTWNRAPAHGEGEGAPAPYSVEVPFDDADLRTLDWCLSGDTVFFAHRSYPPGKLVYADGALSYERISFRQAKGTQPRIASVTQKGKWASEGSDKEVEYCVTAVKDGVESAPSPAYAVSYKLPWPDTGSFVIAVDAASVGADDFDAFYVYKKESDVFGLVGTTSKQVSFVDVSEDATPGGAVYPSGYSFDRDVHFREAGGNRFAAVRRVEEQITTNLTVTTYENIKTKEEALYKKLKQEGVPLIKKQGAGWGHEKIEEVKGTGGTSTRTGATARSLSAQRTSGTATSIEYSLGASGHVMSSFRLRLGSVEHVIRKDVETTATHAYYSFCTSKGYWYNDSPHVVSSATTTKWTGVRTDFTPSPAKHYEAAMTFADGTSCTVACRADVDQAAVDADVWTALGGTPARWRRAYAASERMVSFEGAADVAARMAEPGVGASVEFEVPKEYAAKPCVKIVFLGYADAGKTAGAGVLANGLACFQGGKYVYTFTDNYITPDLTITPPKTEDHFLNPGDYPGCVQIYSQRLVYASSASSPFTFWMSATGDLYNFDVHEYLRASDAITASTAALEMPRINRMLVHRDLMLFADGGEWQVAPSSGNAVSPQTVAAKLQSAIGCADWIRPLAVDSDIVFCDRSGEALMATRYSFASDGYESSNLSVLSQRLFRNNPVEAMAYAQFPESTIECVLADGTLASLVYMKEHDVCAWSLHRLGGGWLASDVASNKATVNGSSHCALVARREGADGGAQWAVLSIRDIDPDDRTLLANLRMDAVRVVETTRAGDGPVQPVTGRGEVAVRVGEVRAADEGGDVSATADRWAVGAPFTSTIRTTSPEFTDRETAQMEVKNATEAEVRVIDGSDFTVRQASVPEARATQMRVPCPVDGAEAAFTVAPGDADCRMPLAGANSRDGSLVLEHDGWLPLAVLSVSTSWRVEFANSPEDGRRDEG